jgi:hypothetical protein
MAQNRELTEVFEIVKFLTMDVNEMCLRENEMKGIFFSKPCLH